MAACEGGPGKDSDGRIDVCFEFTGGEASVHDEPLVVQPAPRFDSNRQLNAASIGSDITPFVDLSEFRMSQPVFRPHPHAGFSAVTYMFEDWSGTLSNRWSKGVATTIPSGCLHWTQAGSGMMHKEIPVNPGNSCHGVQIFFKLAVDDELTEPVAFHVAPEDIVEFVPVDGVRIRLLAGTLGDNDAGIDIRHDLTLAEIHLDTAAEITVPAPSAHNAFVFLQLGTVVTDKREIVAGGAAVFAHDGDHLTLTATEPTSFLFGAGPPLGMNMYTGGPFIMSSAGRLEAAFAADERNDMGRLTPSSEPAPLHTQSRSPLRLPGPGGVDTATMTLADTERQLPRDMWKDNVSALTVFLYYQR